MTLCEYLIEISKRADFDQEIGTLVASCPKHLQSITSFFALMAPHLRRVSEQSASRGYEPLLVAEGMEPVLARGIAMVVISSGQRQAKDAQWRNSVVHAIRFLKDPNRGKTQIGKKSKFLLEASKETSIIETIFAEAHLNVFEFIGLLEKAAKESQVQSARLSEIAVLLDPFLTTPRGPKITAASAAHEFFLENASRALRSPLAYTYNDAEETYTDSLTIATRLEFSNNDFDPRPAYRRMIRRQQKS